MKYNGLKNEYHSELISIYNGDCMNLLKQTPDKYYDLCIVDPPYGLGISGNPFRQKHKKQSWDNAIPSAEYFTELKRISKNQIIWGGNYFDLEPSQGFLIWDKMQPFDFSSAMCEMAWMSIQSPAKIYKKHVVTSEKNKIHPTQKPIQLYEWLLNNYANDNDKIIDTHLGSGSIAIAIDKANTLDKKNLTFVGIELDPEYYRGAVERFKNHKRQCVLF
jgi:site-specific DNA-methyltransferase (adenine-specific)